MEYFPDIPRIVYEGPDSRNPLSFTQYDPDALVEGIAMRDHLRFAAAFWHTMRNPLSDPFGDGTAQVPWDDGSSSLENARRRVDVFFEFLEKTGIDYYCFHDRDVAPEGATLAESNANLAAMVESLSEAQARTGRKLLWGTACLFAHPRYVHGAATSCAADVFAWAAAQVKNAIDATQALGGKGYVFWGGREGYSSLLNTDMKREIDNLARLVHLAVEYGRKIGFTGQFYIEPKPREPSAHQYDSDAAACLNFLREYDLLEHVKLNIETNHATPASRSMRHELVVAMSAGALGSIDANAGTEHLGWDTDRYPTDLSVATEIMLCVLAMGGFSTGGLNFDAKRRRESFEPVDLFHGHIAGMDTFARGLKAAAALRADGRIEEFIRTRYRSWDTGVGARIESGEMDLESLEAYALTCGEPDLESGRQEVLEAIFNHYL